MIFVLLFFANSLPALAAVEPDPAIKLELSSVFKNPPKVSGYPFLDDIRASAKKYGLPTPFVLAVARGESFFDPKAVSATGAIGIMQVMPATAGDYGVSKAELFDPEKNIDVGVHLLADLYHKLKDPYLTLGAYYCGSGGVDTGKYKLRKDCDEYVRYIHTHLARIIERSKGEIPPTKGVLTRFVVTHFNNYLDARDFLIFINKRLTGLKLDLFRIEAEVGDHTEFRYQIIAAHGDEITKSEICDRILKATGFTFCR